MFRKLLISAVIAVTSVTGLSVTAPDVSANPPIHRPTPLHPRHDRVVFEVLYRHRDHWDRYGTYHDRSDAERAAEQLRCQGFVVRIDREFARW